MPKNAELKECPDLCGLFYSIFDDQLGRIKVAEYPNFFTNELFDKISNFVITKEDFANRIIVSDVDKKMVIGCLQSLENIKYKRNKFLFNVCFVVNEEASERLTSYENLVRNVNRFFCSIEQETGKLHSASSIEIENCLKNIFCSLKATGMCQYTWEGFGTVYLQVSKEINPKLFVEREQVPMSTIDLNQCLTPLDMTCQRLLPCLDGESNLWDIAKRSGVELNVVKACIENLGLIGAVKTVAPYRRDSSYVCMPKLRQLLKDVTLQKRLLNHLFGSEFPLGEEESKEIIQNIFRALSSLTPVTKVQDCSNVLLAKINCRLLIQFSEAECLIHRIHGHPLAGPECEKTELSAIGLNEQLADGTHSIEELSCLLDRSYSKVESDIAKSDDMYIIWN